MIKAIFRDLERDVFEYVMYPKIVYKNRSLVSCEESDRDFIESIFINLYSSIGVYSCHPVVFLIKHYERFYSAYERLYKMKGINNFYSEAVKHLFFYAYEVNSKIQNDDIRESYIQGYLLRAYGIRRIFFYL